MKHHNRNTLLRYFDFKSNLCIQKMRLLKIITNITRFERQAAVSTGANEFVGSLCDDLINEMIRLLRSQPMEICEKSTR